MCGIFLYKSKQNDNAEEEVLEGLKKLEYRGYDSYGFASMDLNGKLNLQKFVGKVSDEKIQFGKSRHNTHQHRPVLAF